MAKTEATVTSSVKNWYINFFYRYCWTLWDANWGKKIECFREIGVFRLQGFLGPLGVGRQVT